MDQTTQQSQNEQQSSEASAERNDAQQQSQTQQQAQDAGAGQSDAGAAKRGRPADLDESFWDAEKGEPKVDEIARTLSELRTFKAEADAAAQGVPEDPKQYEIGLPEGFELPEGADGWEPLPDDHPVVEMARKVAHELKLDQTGFKKLVALKAQADIHEEQFFNTRMAEERAKLGDRGPARVESAQNWLKGRIGQKAEALYPMLSTAAQVEAIEDLMRQFRTGGAPPPSAGGRDGGADKPDISELKGAERIHAARQLAKMKR
jgi:hypothetical protein